MADEGNFINCKSPGCEFAGRAETENYCSQCHKQQSRKRSVTAPAYYDESEYESKKCHQCQDFYGAPEYGGFCHGCFMRMTSDPDSSKPEKCKFCREFFGSAEYGGYCYNCFMAKTRVEDYHEDTDVPYDQQRGFRQPLNMASQSYHPLTSADPTRTPVHPSRTTDYEGPLYGNVPPVDTHVQHTRSPRYENLPSDYDRQMNDRQTTPHHPAVVNPAGIPHATDSRVPIYGNVSPSDPPARVPHYENLPSNHVRRVDDPLVFGFENLRMAGSPPRDGLPNGSVSPLDPAMPRPYNPQTPLGGNYTTPDPVMGRSTERRVENSHPPTSGHPVPAPRRRLPKDTRQQSFVIDPIEERRNPHEQQYRNPHEQHRNPLSPTMVTPRDPPMAIPRDPPVNIPSTPPPLGNQRQSCFMCDSSQPITAMNLICQLHAMEVKRNLSQQPAIRSPPDVSGLRGIPVTPPENRPRIEGHLSAHEGGATPFSYVSGSNSSTVFPIPAAAIRPSVDNKPLELEPDDKPRAKILCRTVGCSYYSIEEFHGYCKNCFNGNRSRRES